MEVSNEDKLIPTTEILVKELNRGKDPNVSYYQSEFDRERKPQKPYKQKGPSIAKQIIALLTGAAVGLCIAVAYVRPDIIREYSSTLLFSFKNHPTYTEDKPPASSPRMQEQTNPVDGEKHLRFSDSQIQRAMRNVDHDRQVREYESPNTQKSYTRQGYQFEIELFSGGKIYTDNAQINKDVVSYTNKKGLIISIDREQIKTMKWVNGY